ncbi:OLIGORIBONUCLEASE-LIKE [Salix purpurea]|uniref:OLIGORIBONUCLEASE-LIKE n=1 Tax=Salix purpurea TaxID=77065 RepID=A0A9Q1A264_SALPP|nr:OLIGORIBONUCLEASE-LIKE [Salix purpurea]
MNFLSNAFSLLEVDADDDQLNNAPSSSSKRKNKKKVNGSNVMEKKEKQNGKNLVISSSEECKMPLVWIDLEMTGLNTEVNRILEIACIITDGNLTKSVEVLLYLGHFSVIHDSRLRFPV